MHLALLIPAYNEASHIEALIRSLPKSLPEVERIDTVVIDDGSRDDTSAIARRLGVQVVEHGRNLGLAAAFRSAVQQALALGADAAVTMDADRQFDPGEIATLIEPILTGDADFVAGNRFSGDRRPPGMPPVKYYGNRAMTFVLNRITGGDFADVSCGYRAYSREALLQLNVQSSFTYTHETFIELAAKGLEIEQRPVSVTYYAARASYISGNIVRYGVRTLLTIMRTWRDYAPLSVFFTGACLFAIPGLVLAVFVLIHYLVSGAFSPYIFVAFGAAYLFTIGLALCFLGLATDMLRGIRSNQERLLYFEKKRYYGDD